MFSVNTVPLSLSSARAERASSAPEPAKTFYDLAAADGGMLRYHDFAVLKPAVLNEVRTRDDAAPVELFGFGGIRLVLRQSISVSALIVTGILTLCPP